MSLGPVMMDISGTELDMTERELLRHPLVGGVILFSRNYSNPGQLQELTRQIHELRHPPLLIAVDHEGGRVQRFHGAFTRLPACRRYGERYDHEPAAALDLARRGGWLMAAELRAVGVDLSFAPVLDLDRGLSSVIGDRAFHKSPDTVAELARYFVTGMRQSGMAGVGKHFPGHGGVTADSHLEIPVDHRSYADLMMEDLIPFEQLVDAGLPALMTAHVVYDQVEELPVSFSYRWLKQILRRNLRFQGAVFSDDLNMEGASGAGDHARRVRAALSAGCDMVLLCNNRAAVESVLETPGIEPDPASQVRLMRMHGSGAECGLKQLARAHEWKENSVLVTRIEPEPELGLDDDA